MTKLVSMAPLPGEFIKGMLENEGVAGIEVVGAGFFSREEMKAALQGAEFILGDFSFKNSIDREILEHCKDVKFIQQPSVGYQHIDIEACKNKGIRVANCAGANTVDVAEHTVMSGLCLIKKIMMSNRTTRLGEWRQMEIGPAELAGKAWGILGMGRIGKAVAKRLISFGVELYYYDVHRLEEETEIEMNLKYLTLPELLKIVDILSIHCPLTDETRHLINNETIASMKSGTMIINVARGEIVDEEALAEALEKGKIAGASIDVLSEEPINPENPLLKVNRDNLIMSPHVAGVSEESKKRIINMTILNLAKAIKGEEPENVI